MQSRVSHDGVSQDVHNSVDVYPRVLDVHSWVSHNGRRISTSLCEPSSSVKPKSDARSTQNMDGVYPRVLDVHSWVSQDEVSDDDYHELLDVQSHVSRNVISHNAYPVLLDVHQQVSCETSRAFSADTDIGGKYSDGPGLNVADPILINRELATPG